MAYDYGNVDDLLREADAFIDAEWEIVLSDLEKLIAVNSVEGEADEAADAPFGPGPRQALDVMLGIARGYGFEAGDEHGYMGWADLPGEGDKQLGMISHLDIVPASEGWNFDPFALTRKEGYLIGRGTSDDKGPLLCGFHAMRFWKERNERLGEKFPHNIRMLFGCNEETGMHDVDGYLAAHKAPDFLFTPDADFPVGYGEKGQFTAWLSSERVRGGRILEFEGGSVTNGVPARAMAVVKKKDSTYAPAERISVQEVSDFCTRNACYFGEDLLVITAEGISGHAAFPKGSINAIGLLVRYMLENDLLSEDERTWFEFILPALETTDGSAFGVDCADEDFGALTCVGGVASYDKGVFKQSIDIRYPTATNRDELMRKIGMAVANVSGGVAEKQHMEPFLMDPESAPIQMLLDAYCQATGFEGKPFTMGGGTYARHFPMGASFGPEDSHFPKPEWVGSMHGPDEGVSEENLRAATKVYILAIGNLMKTDL